MNVLKRDKKTVEQFDFNRILSAVERAYKSEETEVPKSVIKCLRSKFNEKDDVTLNVEDIQDEIENCLMLHSPLVAKAFIIYRYQHKLCREADAKLTKSIERKLMAKNVENQNANVDEKSFGGRIGEASRVVTKDYALKHCMSRKSRNNHVNNEIYIHDLDSYAIGESNCLTIPFDDLLKNGFNTRQCDVRPAKSINTAFQLVAVLFQLQSLQQFGGVSAAHLDWTMIPYVRLSFFKHYVMNYIKDVEEFNGFTFDSLLDMSDDELDSWIDSQKAAFLEKFNLTKDDFRLDDTSKLDEKYCRSALFDTKLELKQAVEGMYHNLNTLQSRSGCQLPFTSVNYGTCTLPEGRMVIKALLEGSIRGVGKFNKTSIFPCGIFQCMKGVSREKGDKNYDLFRLALKSTAKRIYPNYANVDWSGNAGYDVNDPRTYFSTMGCRTANGWDINGFGQLKDGRGNICPVTIILPTLAMIAGQDVEKFMKLLDKKIGEAKDMLIERFEHVCSQSPESASFMYENNTMAGYVPEEGIRSALKHGTLAVGQLGLAETLQLLIGKDHTTEEGMELAKRIEGLFKQRCAEFKEEYKLNFGVYYTPAENLCHTALNKFKSVYGEIPNVSDKKFFTNSMHVPVWHQMTPFEKIDIESQLTGYSSAGCITYVELESSVEHNIDALETIVNYAMDKDIPYFAINIPIDSCCDCGYTGDINDVCPKCGSKNITQLRRVTGYLSTDKKHFNDGKIDETDKREKHHKEYKAI